MTETASTREISGEVLVELGRHQSNLVVLGGDLNKSTFANLFGAEHPDRFFDFGPAEQNMVSVAAGLAASGKIPVVSTFTVFATARPYDQLRVGVSQPGLNVKVVATHGGIVTGEDGVSAHGIEDIAIMCALPGFNVIVPADAVEAAAVMKVILEVDGPCYVRLSRPPTPIVHEGSYSFALGRAPTLREGSDVSIVACGIMVHAALEAANALALDGIGCRVINMSTLKPLDNAAIIMAARETGAIVTAEEHYILGGLGSLVSQVVMAEEPVPVESVALMGYAESGTADQLLAKYHLTSKDIEVSVRKVLARRTR